MTTITQDPIDRFTLLMEEFRRERGVHGPAGPLRCLFWGLFIGMMRLLASRAEPVRNGTLADTAPAAAPDQSRAWPPDLRQRQSGWLEHRSPEAAWGGGTMHGPFEQPEMLPEMNEPIAAPPCEMPVVEQPTGLPLPRRPRLRKLQASSGRQPRGRSMGTTAVGRDGMDRGYFGLRMRGFCGSIRRNGFEGVGINALI
jgi:hypothetical protein